MGAAHPLIGRTHGYAHHVHGDDGQGNAGDTSYVASYAPLSAAEQIIACAKARPGEIEIVAVGPLTNLALALGLCPELPGLVRGVTIMGGAALAPGNVTPTAEANIWHDPEAAFAVFEADWLLTVVPLDVTMRTLLTEDDRQTLLAAGGIAELRRPHPRLLLRVLRGAGLRQAPLGACTTCSPSPSPPARSCRR